MKEWKDERVKGWKDESRIGWMDEWACIVQYTIMLNTFFSLMFFVLPILIMRR